jgi:hypothetical protein
MNLITQTTDKMVQKHKRQLKFPGRSYYEKLSNTAVQSKFKFFWSTDFKQEWVFKAVYNQHGYDSH